MSFELPVGSRRVHCNLKDYSAACPWLLLALQRSKNRPDILLGALSAHKKNLTVSSSCVLFVFVYTTMLLIYQEMPPSPPHFLFHILKISSIALTSFLPPLPVYIFLDSHFLKGNPWPKTVVRYVVGPERVVLLKARGLSPSSDRELPG